MKHAYLQRLLLLLLLVLALTLIRNKSPPSLQSKNSLCE
jgi:hypothetical protein